MCYVVIVLKISTSSDHHNNVNVVYLCKQNAYFFISDVRITVQKNLLQREPKQISRLLGHGTI